MIEQCEVGDRTVINPPRSRHEGLTEAESNILLSVLTRNTRPTRFSKVS